MIKQDKNDKIISQLPFVDRQTVALKYFIFKDTIKHQQKYEQKFKQLFSTSKTSCLNNAYQRNNQTIQIKIDILSKISIEHTHYNQQKRFIFASHLLYINFKNLKVLDLHLQQISNIEFLEYIYAPDLNTLNLSGNKIVSLKVLSKLNLSSLESLNLNQNLFNNLQFIRRFHFPKLDYLCLQYWQKSAPYNFDKAIFAKCFKKQNIQITICSQQQIQQKQVIKCLRKQSNSKYKIKTKRQFLFV